MNVIFYPTIDLFTYEFKQALNLIKEQKEENQANFKAKLPGNVEFIDDEIEREYLELSKPIRPGFKTQNQALSGYYYPVRLNDVYGLQIDCSVDNLTEPQSLDAFSDIKAAIDKEIDKSLPSESVAFGKTWLISGWLPEQPENSPQSIAQDIYQNLFTQADWQQNLFGESTFLSSHIFELWQPLSSQNNHVVIILFPNQETAKNAAEFYTDWMGLFAYRHKITWAYQQSRVVKKALVNHYQKVNENINLLKSSPSNTQNLSELKTFFDNIQNILNQYTLDLLNLSFQKQVIEINLFNYQQRLEIIERKAGSNNDLKIFLNFSELAEDKYLQQIEKDTENMKLGLQLLEDNINATRSRIELEKARQDKTFQEFISLLGIGWATSSTVGEILKPGTFENEPIKTYLVDKEFSEESAESISSSVYSLGFAAVIIIIILICKRFWLARDKK